MLPVGWGNDHELLLVDFIFFFYQYMAEFLLWEKKENENKAHPLQPMQWLCRIVGVRVKYKANFKLFW